MTSYVQDNSTGTNVYTSSVPVTLATAATVGNVLIAKFGTNSTATTVSAVSGGGVTTWSKGVTIDSANGDIEFWWGTVATAGQTTVTGTLSGPDGAIGWVGEFSGGSGATFALDNTSTTTGSSSAPTIPPSMSYAAGDILVAAATSTTSESSSSPTGWTTGNHASGGMYSEPTAYQIAASAGTTTAGAWPTSAPTWTSCVIAIKVTPGAPVAPVFTADSAPSSATVDFSYSYTYQATGNPAPTFTGNSLPSWLTLNPTSGLLSGIPTSTGTYTFTVTAQNTAGQATSGTQSITVANNTGPVLVQTNATFSTTSATISFNAATTAGNTLVAQVDCTSGATLTAVPSGWRLVDSYFQQSAAHADLYVFVYENAPSISATTTLTWACNTTGNEVDVAISEWAGLGSAVEVDINGTAYADNETTGTTSITYPSAPAVPGEVALLHLGTGSSTSVTASGMTQLNAISNDFWLYQVAPSTAETVDITLSPASHFRALLLTLRPAPAKVWGSNTGIPRWDHIIVFAFENQSLSTIQTDAPYMSSLMNDYAWFNNYYSVDHPSLPNYMATTSGSEQGTSGIDWLPTVTAANVFVDITFASGRRWATYAENLPPTIADWNIYPSPSGANTPYDLPDGYASRHVPAVFYENIVGNNLQQTYVKDFATWFASDFSAANTVPDFVWVTPNRNDDMHDGTVVEGDTWLQTNMATVLNSPAYTEQNTLIIIWFDENDGNTGGLNQVLSIFVTPTANLKSAGYESNVEYTHYSLLAMIEQGWGQSHLTSNDNTTPITDPFSAQSTATHFRNVNGTAVATTTYRNINGSAVANTEQRN